MDEDSNIVVPKDKMNYKQLLQSFINRCLLSMGDYDDYEDAVNALKAAMFYNSQGINFRDKIIELEKELDAWYDKMVESYKHEYRIGYHPLNAMPVFRKWKYKKNYNLFINLLDMLAKAGMLSESRSSVDKFDETTMRRK